MQFGYNGLTSNKKSEKLLEPKKVYNQVIWLIEQSDWVGTFWAITQEPEFSWTCSLYIMVENHLHYHHVKIQKIPYSPYLSKSEKIIKQSDWLRAFWARTQETGFSWTRSLYVMVENHLYYHHVKFRKFFKVVICKVWKSNWAIWLAKSFLGHNLRTRIFLDMWFA